MRLPHHLKRHPRSGVFYFRLTVPTDLRPIYRRREVKFSLNTRDPVAAKLAAYRLSERYLTLFSSQRTGPRAVRKIDIEALINQIKAGKTSQLIVDRDPRGNILRAIPETPDEFQVIVEMAKAGAFNPAPVHETPVTPPSPPEPQIKAGIPLSQALRDYLEFRETIPKNPNTEKERISSLNNFKAWHEAHIAEIYQVNANGSDWPINQISDDAIDAYRRYLTAKKPEGRGLHIKTMQTQGSYLHTFFSYCRRQRRFIAANQPLVTEHKFTIDANAKRINEVNTRKKHLGFTAEELSRIFNPATYPRSKPDEWFVPLILLFTGARLREITDLKVAYFQYDYGMNYIHVHGTKNANSKRYVPLHPELIRLGLLDYVADVRQLGFTHLFPYLSRTQTLGLKKEPSRRINAYFESLGIKANVMDEGQKTTHSWRHTVNHRLIDNKHVDDSVREDYLGHATSGTNRRKYGKQVALEKAVTIVEHLRYPGLDLSPFTYQKGAFRQFLIDEVAANPLAAK